MPRDYEAEAEARWERRMEYADDSQPKRTIRKTRGCWCNLDGYPGHCPGSENCPYSGYHDEEEISDHNNP
jgi:hypothetical protein